MRWNPGGEQSQNIEDRRGAGMGGRSTIGIGGVVILFVLSLIFGRDLVSPVLQQQAEVPQTTGQAPPLETTPQEEAKVTEIRYMLGDLEVTWASLLGREIPETHVGAVPRRDALRVRHGRKRDGAVLLSG